jgi:hypothetical protein
VPALTENIPGFTLLSPLSLVRTSNRLWAQSGAEKQSRMAAAAAEDKWAPFPEQRMSAVDQMNQYLRGAPAQGGLRSSLEQWRPRSRRLPRWQLWTWQQEGSVKSGVVKGGTSGSVKSGVVKSGSRVRGCAQGLQQRSWAWSHPCMTVEAAAVHKVCSKGAGPGATRLSAGKSQPRSSLVSVEGARRRGGAGQRSELRVESKPRVLFEEETTSKKTSPAAERAATTVAPAAEEEC